MKIESIQDLYLSVGLCSVYSTALFIIQTVLAMQLILMQCNFKSPIHIEKY